MVKVCRAGHRLPSSHPLRLRPDFLIGRRGTQPRSMLPAGYARTTRRLGRGYTDTGICVSCDGTISDLVEEWYGVTSAVRPAALSRDERVSSTEVWDLLEVWRRGPGSNWRIKVLQTSPLPLGYRAPWRTNQPQCNVLGRKGIRSAGTLCIAREEMIGAGDRGRTGDIFLGKEALYH